MCWPQVHRQIGRTGAGPAELPGGGRHLWVQHLQQPDGACAVGMQEAEVAGAAKPSGQHMLRHQPQKVRPGQCVLRRLVGLGVAVLEGDVALGVAAQDVGLPDQAAVQVAAQI